MEGTYTPSLPPHPRLSASLFSPPVPPLRARLPAGEVKEKLTDLRKTNLAVNPTSNRRPCLNSRDGEQRAPAAGNPASSFSQALHPTPHPPPPREGAGGGLGRKVFLTGSSGDGRMVGRQSIHTIPLHVCLRSKSK